MPKLRDRHFRRGFLDGSGEPAASPRDRAALQGQGYGNHWLRDGPGLVIWLLQGSDRACRVLGLIDSKDRLFLCVPSSNMPGQFVRAKGVAVRVMVPPEVLIPVQVLVVFRT